MEVFPGDDGGEDWIHNDDDDEMGSFNAVAVDNKGLVFVAGGHKIQVLDDQQGEELFSIARHHEKSADVADAKQEKTDDDIYGRRRGDKGFRNLTVDPRNGHVYAVTFPDSYGEDEERTQEFQVSRLLESLSTTSLFLW